MERGEPRERWFETSVVFWFGAILPPVGAVLSLGALFERWRHGRMPTLGRLPLALVGLAPSAWLCAWACLRLAGERLAGDGLPDAVWQDPMARLCVVSLALHLLFGALGGALWGARSKTLLEAALGTGMGAIAGCGWAWCLAGLFAVRSSLARGRLLEATVGPLFMLVGVSSLFYARRMDRTLPSPLEWGRVSDA